MPSPSKNWTQIVDAQVDADSPIDTTLITGLRDDLVHLREWLGKDYTAAQNHAHNGVDSAQVSYADIPKTVGVELFDDFLGNAISTLWTVDTGVTLAADASVTPTGVIEIAGAAGVRSFSTSANPNFNLNAGNTLTFETRFKGTDVYIPTDVVLGLANATTYTGPANSIAFEGHSGPANWQAVTRSGGTATTTNTGVAIDPGTAWQKLKIVATPSSVLFYVNDVLKATHTTNIPTANLGVVGTFFRNVQSSKYRVDYIHVAGSVRNS